MPDISKPDSDGQQLFNDPSYSKTSQVETPVEDTGLEPKDSSSEAPTETPGRTGKEIWQAFIRPGRAQIVVAIALGLVAMFVVWQVRTNRESATYSQYRRSDLIQVLEQLEAETNRLNREIDTLEETKRELESGQDSERIAKEEAEKRISNLSILAGTVPAVGPGIRIIIEDPNNSLTATVLVDSFGELRDAGAEAIEINDSIRVVGQSWVKKTDQGLIVDDELVTSPITIDVIGNPKTLEQGIRFRGGMVSQIESERIGGKVHIYQETDIVVDSIRPTTELKFGRPA